MLTVDTLQNGIVIDHITAGRGKQIYNALHLDEVKTGSVALLQNVKSEKYGSKDMIKIEGDAQQAYPLLGYLDPQITVIRITAGRIITKETPARPSVLVGVAHCKNPRCITSVEADCQQIFIRSRQNTYRCKYCEQELSL